MTQTNLAGRAGRWSASHWKTALFGWMACGIRCTAGTVTSAAIIMVAVFAIFGTLQLIMMKQLGVGLALAVLIDATIIRACSCRRR